MESQHNYSALNITTDYLNLNMASTVEFTRDISTEYLNWTSTIESTTDISTEYLNWTPTIESTTDISHCRVANTVNALLGCFGILGNGLVIYVILRYKPMLKHFNNLYIINQSIIDFVSSILMLMHTPICNLTPDLRGVSGPLYCLLYTSRVFYWLSVMASTYNLVLLTCDRYMSVVHVVWYKTSMTKKRVYMLLAITWFIGFIIYFPWGIASSGIVNEVCYTWTLYSYPSTRIVLGIFNLLITFPIPTVIMVCCYIKMAAVLKNQGKVSPSHSSHVEKQRQDKMNKARINILVTMTIMGLCFVCCWASSSIYYFLYTLGYPFQRDTAFYQFTVYATNFNSLINPILYVIFYKQFKKAVKFVILRKLGNSPDITNVTKE